MRFDLLSRGTGCALALMYVLLPLATAQAATPAAAPATAAAVSTAPGVSVAPIDPQVRASIEAALGEKPDSIIRMPMAGLYEVQVKNQMLYTDAKGEFAFVGNIIDLRSGENITKVRIEALRDALLPKVTMADFPLDAAVKIVKGSGKRTIIAFEDPNCGYCKKLEQTLVGVNDVTVYVFLYPILGDDSVSKSHSIWCASNPGKTWESWMIGGTAITAQGECKNPIDKNVALGEKLGVNATPTMFFANGKRVAGAISADEVNKYLSAAQS